MTMANEFARRLRRDMTEEGRILWSELRRRQLMGLRFRRQVPLGSHIVDFACLERRFIVEVDGLQHSETRAQTKDAERTAWLQAQGFKVFRAWNGEIRDNLNGVLESMLGEMGLLAPTMTWFGDDKTASASPPSGATRHLPCQGGGEAASGNPASQGGRT